MDASMASNQYFVVTLLIGMWNVDQSDMPIILNLMLSRIAGQIASRMKYLRDAGKFTKCGTITQNAWQVATLLVVLSWVRLLFDHHNRDALRGLELCRRVSPGLKLAWYTLARTGSSSQLSFSSFSFLCISRTDFVSVQSGLRWCRQVVGSLKMWICGFGGGHSGHQFSTKPLKTWPWPVLARGRSPFAFRFGGTSGCHCHEHSAGVLLRCNCEPWTSTLIPTYEVISWYSCKSWIPNIFILQKYYCVNFELFILHRNRWHCRQYFVFCLQSKIHLNIS